MNERGDSTLLLAQWVDGITEVTAAEAVAFAHYANWPIRKVLQRLAAFGVRVIPDELAEAQMELVLEALRRGDTQ
jgi:hypothetical protein